MAWKVELKLPGVSVANDDVGSLFRRRRPDGPFVIANRLCGLALDTAYRTANGERPHLWQPHAQPHQRWVARPSRTRGEVLLVSETNRLALDATTDGGDGHPVMWESHGEAWQRWRLHDNPDGVGYRIQSVHSGRYLAANQGSSAGCLPWFEAHAKVQKYNGYSCFHTGTTGCGGST